MIPARFRPCVTETLHMASVAQIGGRSSLAFSKAPPLTELAIGPRHEVGVPDSRPPVDNRPPVGRLHIHRHHHDGYAGAPLHEPPSAWTRF